MSAALAKPPRKRGPSSASNFQWVNSLMNQLSRRWPASPVTDEKGKLNHVRLSQQHPHRNVSSRPPFFALLNRTASRDVIFIAEIIHSPLPASIIRSYQPAICMQCLTVHHLQSHWTLSWNQLLLIAHNMLRSRRVMSSSNSNWLIGWKEVIQYAM